MCHQSYESVLSGTYSDSHCGGVGSSPEYPTDIPALFSLRFPPVSLRSVYIEGWDHTSAQNASVVTHVVNIWQLWYNFYRCLYPVAYIILLNYVYRLRNLLLFILHYMFRPQRVIFRCSIYITLSLLCAFTHFFSSHAGSGMYIYTYTAPCNVLLIILIINLLKIFLKYI
jgi:hypothetical protein